MRNNYRSFQLTSSKRSILPGIGERRQALRAIIELVDGEIKIFPIARSDADEKTILDALRFAVADEVASK